MFLLAQRAADAVNDVTAGQCVESSISLTARQPSSPPRDATRRRFQSPLRLFNYCRSAALRPSDYLRSAGFDSDRLLPHTASPLSPFVRRGRDGMARLGRRSSRRTESLERRQFHTDSVCGYDECCKLDCMGNRVVTRPVPVKHMTKLHGGGVTPPNY